MTVRSDLEQLRPLTDSIINLTRPALQALDNQLVEAGTGYPTTASGADRQRSTGPVWWVAEDPLDPDAPAGYIPVTSVEATVGRTATLNHTRTRLEERLAAVVRDLRALDIDLRRQIPVPEQKRCNRGTGREGLIEWGDPLCVNYAEPDRGGMCSACAKREYRWRKDHGLPARERDIA